MRPRKWECAGPPKGEKEVPRAGEGAVGEQVGWATERPPRC